MNLFHMTVTDGVTYGASIVFFFFSINSFLNVSSVFLWHWLPFAIVVWIRVVSYFIPTTPFRYIYLHFHTYISAHISMLCPLNTTETDGKCWSDGMGRWADKFGSDDAVRVHIYVYRSVLCEWVCILLDFFRLSVSMCATFNTLRCFIINILLSLYHASDIKHRWRTNANEMIADLKKVNKAMPIFLFISKTKADVRE